MPNERIKYSAREIFEAALQFRSRVRQEYLKSIHSNSKDRVFINKAENELLKGTYNAIGGMTPEQEALLATHEEVSDFIKTMAKYL